MRLGIQHAKVSWAVKSLTQGCLSDNPRFVFGSLITWAIHGQHNVIGVIDVRRHQAIDGGVVSGFSKSCIAALDGRKGRPLMSDDIVPGILPVLKSYPQALRDNFSARHCGIGSVVSLGQIVSEVCIGEQVNDRNSFNGFIPVIQVVRREGL